MGCQGPAQPPETRGRAYTRNLHQLGYFGLQETKKKKKLFTHTSFKYDLIQALNHVNQTQFFAAFSRLGLLCWYHSQGGFPWLQQLQTVSFQG